jgi:hypothetical protein
MSNKAKQQNRENEMNAYQTIIDQFKTIQVLGRNGNKKEAIAVIANLKTIVRDVKEDPMVAKYIDTINKQIGIFEGLCK